MYLRLEIRPIKLNLYMTHTPQSQGRSPCNLFTIFSLNAKNYRYTGVSINTLTETQWIHNSLLFVTRGNTRQHGIGDSIVVKFSSVLPNVSHFSSFFLLFMSFLTSLSPFHFHNYKNLLRSCRSFWCKAKGVHHYIPELYPLLITDHHFMQLSSKWSPTTSQESFIPRKASKLQTLWMITHWFLLVI